MATPEERRKAKQLAKDRRAHERALRREARDKQKADAKEAKRVAKQAAKSYRNVSADKAYCPNCSEWYDPRNKKQNRKHNHL